MRTKTDSGISANRGGDGPSLQVLRWPPSHGDEPSPPLLGSWRLAVGHAALCLLVFVLLAPLLTGCGEARAQQEDRRILAEFRGPNFIPPGERRDQPMGPPMVPHLVYRENFNCLVCHGHKDFHFRGQPVKPCPHPERVACLQCHVPWQNKDAPFKFEMLGTGAQLVSANAKSTR